MEMLKFRPALPKTAIPDVEKEEIDHLAARPMIPGPADVSLCCS